MTQDELLTIREELLKHTDKYALPDFPHESEEIRQAWLAYRQALRDITETYTSLDDVVWPTKPS